MKNSIQAACAAAITMNLLGSGLATAAAPDDSEPMRKKVFGPNTPVPPAEYAIFAEFNRIRSVTAPQDTTPITGAQYAQIGYRMARESCSDYFDRLISKQNANLYSNDLIGGVSTTSSTILGLTSTPSKVIGIVSATFGLASSSLSNYNSRALMTPYPAETRGMILAALELQERILPPSSSTTVMQAKTNVSLYSDLCSLSNITLFAKQVLATAKPRETSTEMPATVLASGDQIRATAVGEVLGPVTLSDEDLALLTYYLVTDPSTYTDKAKSKAVLDALPDEVAKKLKNADGSAKTPSAVPEAITARQLLTPIVASNFAFKAMVEARRQAIQTGQAPAAPADAGAATEAPTAKPSVTFLPY